MIYLASPYTSLDPNVLDDRWHQALRYVMLRMEMGETIFSPIVYGHQFIQRDSSYIPANKWIDLNTHMLTTASELRILKLAGWEDSAGIFAELKLAEDLGLKITYVEPLK